MANQRANKVTIPIDGALNMNRYRANVRQFEGLNDNNGVIFGDTLSPLYQKNEPSQKAVFDKDGNKYSVAGGVLTRTDADGNETVLLSGFSESGFAKERAGEFDHCESFDTNGVTTATITVSDGAYSININGQAYEAGAMNDIVAQRVFVVDPAVIAVFLLPNSARVFLFPFSDITDVRTYTKDFSTITTFKFASSDIRCTFCGDDGDQNGYLITFLPAPGQIKNWQVPSSMNGATFNVFVTETDAFSDIVALGETVRFLRDGESTPNISSCCAALNESYIFNARGFTNSISPYHFLGYPTGFYVSGRNAVIQWQTGMSINLTNRLSTTAAKGMFIGQDFFKYLGDSGYSNRPVAQISHNGFNDRFGCTVNQDGTYENGMGDITNLGIIPRVRLLYNENFLSGISYGEVGFMGTLLEGWYNIDIYTRVITRPWYSGNQHFFCLYRKTDGKVYRIRDGAENSVQILNGRYVVVNTTSYKNCWDIKKEKVAHYASDYNMRAANAFIVDGNTQSVIKTPVLVASAINASYEIEDEMPSMLPNPKVLVNFGGGSNGFIKSELNDERIDTYWGESSAVYQNSGSSVDANLIDTTYPVATDGNRTLTPSIFSRYVNSYNNVNFVVNDEISFKMLTYNNSPVLAYAQNSAIERFDGVFVLQGQTFFIVDKKIVGVAFSGGTVSASDIIADCAGYQYLGCNTKAAFFYSALDRSIYSFTGDNVLNRLYEADRIKAVNGAFYNPITQSIYISTTDETAEDGEAKEVQCLYIFGQNTARIDGVPKVNALYCTEKKFIVLDTDGGLIYLAYTELDGYEKQTLKVRTEFYGTGNNEVSVIDCWYVRLFNGNRKTAGKVKFRVRTLTDKGTETAEKTVSITPDMWDELTNTAYIRYQPERQRGVGAQLCIESDFAIGQIACDYLPDTQQIAHINA